MRCPVLAEPAPGFLSSPVAGSAPGLRAQSTGSFPVDTSFSVCMAAPGEMGSLASAGADYYISKDTNTHHILDLVKSVLG